MILDLSIAFAWLEFSVILLQQHEDLPQPLDASLDCTAISEAIIPLVNASSLLAASLHFYQLIDSCSWVYSESLAPLRHFDQSWISISTVLDVTG